MKFPAGEGAVRRSARAWLFSVLKSPGLGCCVVETEITYLHRSKCVFGDKYFFVNTVTIKERTICKVVIIIILLPRFISRVCITVLTLPGQGCLSDLFTDEP